MQIVGPGKQKVLLEEGEFLRASTPLSVLKRPKALVAPDQVGPGISTPQQDGRFGSTKAQSGPYGPYQLR